VVKRWLRFNAVGLLGACVQLAVLHILNRLGVQYLIATAVAVESAVLQNYFWHVRWTWPDRPGSLWRFHLANGIVSLASNLLLMRLFTGRFGWAVVPANLLAISITSILNFSLGDRWVFRPASPIPDRIEVHHAVDRRSNS
jgi:putative flippase GtrA